jgi:alpha-galactosidase
MKKFEYGNSKFGQSAFITQDGRFLNESLFGFRMNPEEVNLPFRLSRMFDLDSSLGPLHERNMVIDSIKEEDDSLEVQWSLYNGKAEWTSCFFYYSDLGIWKREDRIRNTGDTEITVSRALVNYTLLPASYEVFHQKSRWCYENDGRWSSLQNLYLQSEGGRTTQGATPFIAIRENGGKGVAFHIVPKGDWEISVRTPSPGVGNPAESVVQIQLGHRSDKLNYSLAPGEEWLLPELLIQSAPTGELHQASPNLHRYFLQVDKNRHNHVHPLVYNPWFDNYAMLDNTERLRKHLFIAKQLGCEVFEIDAGWYGQNGGDWWQQAGDWRERLDGAFRGKMQDFVKEVEAAGLGFGLWMEPERVGENVPVRKENPDWFAWGDGYYYPRLHIPEVYQYIYGEISRLIETYHLKWMKFDFNFELGEDELGKNYYAYYDAWYGMLEELRVNYPETFLEGCASGGLRSDIRTVQSFDGHFLSDNVNPWDSLRAFQQGILRLPPYRLIKWLVIQPGAKVSRYGASSYEQHSTVVTVAPPGAGFDEYEKIDLDFACLIASCGMFGLSGNFIDFDTEEIALIKKHLNFYKEWRSFFKEAVVYQNEEPKSLGDRQGWSTLQFSDEIHGKSLLYVFKLHDLQNSIRCTLNGLDPSKTYRVTLFGGNEELHTTGKELMEKGIKASLQRNSAVLYMIELNK